MGTISGTRLIGPATERLLDVRSGQCILDLACGNGVFSRRLAELGAKSQPATSARTSLERAKTRTTAFANRIEYRLVDVTDRQQLLALGQGPFDAVVCNMALMDIATITPLLEALGSLLKPAG